MRTVWKFQTETSYIRWSIPVGAKLLSVGSKGNKVTAWFEIDDSAEAQERHFIIVGTGWPITGNAKHLGTTQIGAFVWHLYEVSSKTKEAKN